MNFVSAAFGFFIRVTKTEKIVDWTGVMYIEIKTKCSGAVQSIWKFISSPSLNLYVEKVLNWTLLITLDGQSLFPQRL